MPNLSDFTSWGQVVFSLALAGLAIVGAIVLLVKSMGSGYGSVIKALQEQNVGQQAQLNFHRQRLDSCETKHDECEKRYDELKRRQDVMAVTVDAVEKKVNGGHK